MTDSPLRELNDEHGSVGSKLLTAAGALFVSALIMLFVSTTPYTILIAALSLVVGLTGFSQLENEAEEKSASSKTTYHRVVYTIPKGAVEVTVQIQLEILTQEVNPTILSQLENCLSGPLFELFHDSPTIPTRQTIRSTMELALARKQREINLSILPMEIIGLSEKDIKPANDGKVKPPDLWT